MIVYEFSTGRISESLEGNALLPIIIDDFLAKGWFPADDYEGSCGQDQPGQSSPQGNNTPYGKKPHHKAINRNKKAWNLVVHSDLTMPRID